MAITFPTPLAQFFDILPIASASLDLTEQMELNQNGRGELLTSDLGDRLWRMDIALRDDYHSAHERVKARLNLFRQPGRAFFARALPNAFPRHDPDGSILGSAEPLLNAVNPNFRDIRLGGLPVGYRIYDGDYLAFSYGTNPVRQALHQVIIPTASEYVQVPSGGITPVFEVQPEIRAGYALNAEVTLISPSFKAIIIPDTTSVGNSQAKFTKGIKFSIQQTLRN